MTKPLISEMKDFKLDEITNKVEVIKSVCPINMSIIIPKSDGEDSDNYAFMTRITWLCKTVFNSLFCITSNYIAESELDEEFIISNPLLEDKAYLNYRIESDMLMGTMPHYLTDLEFGFDSEFESIHNASDAEIYCVGLEYKEDQTIFHKITVSPEVYGVLKFFDQYMLDGILNFGNLKQSILAGPIEDNETSIFVVNKINVTGLAKVGKRKSTSIAVKMEVSHDSKSSEKYTLLVPFDVGKRYPKKKFGKITTDKLTENYMKDAKNYVSGYTFVTELNDKEYLFLRCSNIAGDSKLFAIETDIRKALMDAIEEYQG